MVQNAINDETGEYGRYFSDVQNEIKKLISGDKEIKSNEVGNFNNEIFTNQTDEKKLEIKGYIDRACDNKLDIKKVAKELYDEFKLQVKNNLFNQKDSQPVPNSMLWIQRMVVSL